MLANLRDEWEEWQSDLKLAELQAQIQAATKRKRRAASEVAVDLDAPRQVGLARGTTLGRQATHRAAGSNERQQLLTPSPACACILPACLLPVLQARTRRVPPRCRLRHTRGLRSEGGARAAV